LWIKAQPFENIEEMPLPRVGTAPNYFKPARLWRLDVDPDAMQSLSGYCKSHRDCEIATTEFKFFPEAFYELDWF